MPGSMSSTGEPAIASGSATNSRRAFRLRPIIARKPGNARAQGEPGANTS